MRPTLVRAALVALGIMFATSSPARAAAHPDRFDFGAGGTLTNPCNGHPFSYVATGTGRIVENGHLFLVKEHGTGVGTDASTGETYKVTFDLLGTTSKDGSGSFTGHVLIAFIGPSARTTFLVHSIANVNFRPGDPVSNVFEFFSCAGVGRTT